MRNWSIGRRLSAGFLVVILGMVALVAVGIAQVRSIDSGLTTINDQNAWKQRLAISFRGSVHDRAIAVRDVVTRRTPATPGRPPTPTSTRCSSGPSRSSTRSSSGSAPGTGTRP